MTECNANRTNKMDTRNLVFIFEYYQRESELRKKKRRTTLLLESRMLLSRVFPILFLPLTEPTSDLMGKAIDVQLELKASPQHFPLIWLNTTVWYRTATTALPPLKKVAQLVVKTLSPTVPNFTPNFSALPADGRHWTDTELICSLYPSAAAVTLPLNAI